MEYQVSKKRTQDCTNGVKVLVEFMRERSRSRDCWSNRDRTFVIANSIKTFFEAHGSQNPDCHTSIFVSSDSSGGLAIAVTARYTQMDIRNMVSIQEFLKQFVDEGRLEAYDVMLL